MVERAFAHDQVVSEVLSLDQRDRATIGLHEGKGKAVDNKLEFVQGRVLTERVVAWVNGSVKKIPTLAVGGIRGTVVVLRGRTMRSGKRSTERVAPAALTLLPRLPRRAVLGGVLCLLALRSDRR
jgi:hypothetical protein